MPGVSTGGGGFSLELN